MSIPSQMAGVILTGHGGLECLCYRQDLPVPDPQDGEVLVKVSATAKNNTDRKVREGLYPTENNESITSFQLGRSQTLTFPRIQGADVVGRIVKVGGGVPASRIGERGLLDFNIYSNSRPNINLVPDYFGHGRDGGFAEFVAVPNDQFHVINNPELSDAETASLGMCSYQTALRMLNAASVGAGENVLVTGASGGVGTALIQLCRLLGSIPHAISSPGKQEKLKELGAESVIERTPGPQLMQRVRNAIGDTIIDASMDLVGGPFTIPLIDLMTMDMSARSSYPRLSIAGASAGNVTEMLWTKIYLHQVQIFGVSHGTRNEADQIINWIRQGALKPVLYKTFRLSDIHLAEKMFVERGSNFVGKIVIVPDSEWDEHGARFAL
jgi:NADPH:quinone reductase-like Zn-dependent oxidoreductase